MKGQFFCGICFVTVIGGLFGQTLLAEELPWEKKLPFEQATIQYTVSGVEQGTKILYIRNFGKEQATYLDSTTKLMGMAVSEKTVEFMDADYLYSYDLQAQEGTKSVNPQKYMAEAYSSLTPEEKQQVQKNAAQMGGALAGGMGGAVQENVAKILGYDCDKIAIMGGGATYLIHGTSIALKTEVNMMGMKMVTLATSLDTGKVDPQHFIHPKGIKAKSNPEADAMAQAMGQRVMDALKDPDAAKKGPVTGLQSDAMQQNMTEEDKQMIEQAGELLKGMQNIFGQ
jgi:hypothetical protein